MALNDRRTNVQKSLDLLLRKNEGPTLSGPELLTQDDEHVNAASIKSLLFNRGRGKTTRGILLDD